MGWKFAGRPLPSGVGGADFSSSSSFGCGTRDGGGVSFGSRLSLCLAFSSEFTRGPGMVV